MQLVVSVVVAVVAVVISALVSLLLIKTLNCYVKKKMLVGFTGKYKPAHPGHPDSGDYEGLKVHISLIIYKNFIFNIYFHYIYYSKTIHTTCLSYLFPKREFLYLIKKSRL